MPRRVAVFIDAQNLYKGARGAFFSPTASHVCGQFDPLLLGEAIAARDPDRICKSVYAFTGRPDATKQPRAYAAHMKQCAAWEAAGVEVVHRTLRYPPTWGQPGVRGEEKGIDVALAIAFVAMAMKGQYDVGVIASTDTDLKPALEVVGHEFKGKINAEVMAWRRPGAHSPRLSVKGGQVWCHWFDRAQYDAVADTRDYNL